LTVRHPVRILVGSLAATLSLLAMPALAMGNDDNGGGGAGGGGVGGGGITWSVLDSRGNGPDLISGVNEEPLVAPVAGTPLCGHPPVLAPEFPVSGDITVQDSPPGSDQRAFGSGNVPAFGGGVGAPFSFAAVSGPLGENATGTFALGFPTGRPSSGRVTCLDVDGNIAFIGGERRAGDDDGDDDDDGGDG
jgi:hypothetical protein